MVRTGIETPDPGGDDFYRQPPERQAAAELDERIFTDPVAEADATAAEGLLGRQQHFLGDPDAQDNRGEKPGPQPGPQGDQQ